MSTEKQQYRRTGGGMSEYVDPAKVRPLVEGVRSQLARLGAGGVGLAAVLHEIAASELDYESGGPGYNREIREAWEAGGNCVDQSIVLASMFEAAGFRTRFVSISRRQDGDHMFPELQFQGISPSAVTDTLDEYASGRQTVTRREYAWEEDRDRQGPWFIADPVSSRYIGDLRGLRRDGYVAETHEGWSWISCDSIERVRR